MLIEHERSTPELSIPPEQLSEEEVSIMAAMHLHEQSAMYVAREFFEVRDRYIAEETTDFYGSATYVMSDGTLLAFIRGYPGTDPKILLFSPRSEYQYAGFVAPIAKVQYFRWNQPYAAQTMVEPTFYIGDEAVAARLEATPKAPLQPCSIGSLEELTRQALSLTAWDRAQAVEAFSIQQGRAYFLRGSDTKVPLHQSGTLEQLIAGLTSDELVASDFPLGDSQQEQLSPSL